ncbi:M48 family metalloprotease [Adhaeribacter soli]|uniref:Membrane-binding protein n=1 Tax=Adhaeribacter soli TaxID=2607655 RepID=A0A5N1IQF9_9BACT|nr:membrane-binding protein [Adhaeribacter soli]KAA9331998.1 membrane-binding protein [Adhaeribacter soli]
MNKKIRYYYIALLLGLTTLSTTPQIAFAQQNNRTAKIRGARDIVKEIIDVVGLTPRFEMREANIDNAAAVILNGQRYILYNTRFLNEVNNASRTDWAAVSILAHEIGHHLNGHTLVRGGSNPADELEADEFSGFVLRKMGASLADAQAAMAVLSDDRDSHTHPGRTSRLAAIGNGWRNANNQMLATNSVVSDKPAQVRNIPKTKAVITQVQPKQAPAQQVALDNRFILSKVTFKNAPKEEYFITTRGNLVRVKDNQLLVIGQLTQTNHEDFPFMVQGSQIAPLFVSKTGIIYNQQGKKLGWLS